MKIDVREYALRALETSKEDLQKDEYLIPVAFIVTNEEVLDYNMQFEDSTQKASVYAELVEVAKQKGALAIITINDATIKSPPEGTTPNPRTRSATGNELQECIFVTVSGPSIQTWSVSVPYSRTNQGIEFGKPQETLNDILNLLPGWAHFPQPS